MMYGRDKYVDKLMKKRNNGRIKVVTGLRRVGKSFLLNELLKKRLIEEGFDENNIISFAFDSAFDLAKIGEDLLEIKETKRKVDPHKFLPYIEKLTSGEGPYVLLFDEIQELGNFEAVLNGYLVRKNADVFVSGSNAHLLSVDVATQFGKRGEEIHLFPLSFSEFYAHQGGDKGDALNEYLLYGGMPTVTGLESDEEKMEELKSLLETLYLRDIITRNGVEKEKELSSLLDIMSSSVGSLTNPNKLADTFSSVIHSSLSKETIGKYLGYFEKSFLLGSCLRYDVKGKSYIETPHKYYFEDTGLRNSRIEFRQFDEGCLLENAVYIELLRRGYAVSTGTIYRSEKNVNGNNVRKELEVDFIAKMGNRQFYIQCCNSLPEGEKEEKEKRGLRSIKDSFKKILLVNRSLPRFYDNDGILTLGAFDFLLNDDALERF